MTRRTSVVQESVSTNILMLLAKNSTANVHSLNVGSNHMIIILVKKIDIPRQALNQPAHNLRFSFCRTQEEFLHSIFFCYHYISVCVHACVQI